MKDDGTMARMPDLEKFAEEHGLMIISIADLIQYRTQTERLVERVASGELELDETGHTWNAYLYRSRVDDAELLALVLGRVDEQDEPVLCRVHRGSTIGDVLSSGKSEGGKSLRIAIRKIEQAGRGVVLYLPPKSSLGAEFEAHLAARTDKGDESKQVCPLREFGLGAQVLADLGLQRISILTNNPRKIAGIAGYGLEVVQSIPLR
jgi:3,4-dihydroxy 2-butanone 4-phosphate synthase/GTP cyclohydrolase II